MGIETTNTTSLNANIPYMVLHPSMYNFLPYYGQKVYELIKNRLQLPNLYIGLPPLFTMESWAGNYLKNWYSYILPARATLAFASVASECLVQIGMMLLVFLVMLAVTLSTGCINQ
jgi:type III secretory pathway component EscU